MTEKSFDVIKNNVDEQLSLESSNDDLHLFLEALKKQENKTAGNVTLKNALEWKDDDRYWVAHGRAIERGFVVRGRGRGGSVHLIDVEETNINNNDVVQNNVQFIPNERNRELDLYDPAKTVLQTWARAAKYDEFRCEITALRGRAATGGKWTRPDISVLGIKSWTYFPTRVFDIVTFEIKPEGQTTVEGIFEALSHQQFATHSYCVYKVSLGEKESFEDKYHDAARILSTARRHGVGVIVASDIKEWNTWDQILDADRVSPDPEQANRFIGTGFAPDVREMVIKWQK